MALIGRANYRRDDEVTLIDVAKYFNVTRGLVRGQAHRWQAKGGYRYEINESWQILYSHFFHLIETGQLVPRIDPQTRKKVLVRVPMPATPPRKTLAPKVDFATMKLKVG